MRKKGNPESDFISLITKHSFQPDGHEDIVHKIAQDREDKEKPVQVQKNLAYLNIVDRSQKEKNDDYCYGDLDNPKGISF
jgi:hypothetical protein